MIHDEEEDESVWLDKSRRGPLSLSEEERGEAEEEAEEEEELSPSPGPGTPVPKPAPAPVPTPTAVTSTAPVFGECCKRMKAELAEQTNVMKWKDHKENPIIVFSHNLNKILCCPWCGVKVP